MDKIFDVTFMISKVLATFASALLAFDLCAISYDVAMRNLGLQPPIWTSSFAEYSLTYVTMFGAPYLVHTSGHVFVEAGIRTVFKPIADQLEKVVYLLCVLVCLYLTYYSAGAYVTAWQSGDFDIRAFDLPRTYLYFPMMVGFFLCAIEFVRFLIGRDSMFKKERVNSEML